MSATGFAIDEEGEIFAIHTWSGGPIYQLTPAPPLPAEPDAPVAEEPALRLWPNPTATTLEVRAPRDPVTNELGTVEVYDLLGRHLTSQPLQPSCQCARQDLDVSVSPPGVYVARVRDLTQPFTVVR